MAASHHQPQQTPTRQVDGLTLQGSSFRRRQYATHVQVKRLLKQQPYGGSATHAVTAPTVKALQLIWRKAYMGWMA
jgi:hypothetical protein